MSALLFTPWPVGIVLIAPHAGRWADTISAPAISTLGLVIFVVGLILLATLPASPSMWDICLRSLVCGIGFGCFQSPNNREMLSNVIREHASYASGVLSIMRTFGQCLGAAAVAVLLAADEGQFMLRCGAPPRPLRYRSSSARAGCVKSLILRKQDKRENITKRYDSSASSAKRRSRNQSGVLRRSSID